MTNEGEDSEFSGETIEEDDDGDDDDDKDEDKKKNNEKKDEKELEKKDEEEDIDDEFDFYNKEEQITYCKILLEKYSETLPKNSNEFFLFIPTNDNKGEKLNYVFLKNNLTIFVADSNGNTLKGFYSKSQDCNFNKHTDITNAIEGLITFLKNNKTTNDVKSLNTSEYYFNKTEIKDKCMVTIKEFKDVISHLDKIMEARKNLENDNNDENNNENEDNDNNEDLSSPENVYKLVEKENLIKDIMIFDNYIFYSLDISLCYLITANKIEQKEWKKPCLYYLLPDYLNSFHEEMLKEINKGSPSFFEKLNDGGLYGTIGNTQSLVSEFVKLLKKLSDLHPFDFTGEDVKIKCKNTVDDYLAEKQLELKMIPDKEKTDFDKIIKYYDFFSYLNWINESQITKLTNEDELKFKKLLVLFENLIFFDGMRVGKQFIPFKNVVPLHKNLTILKEKNLCIKEFVDSKMFETASITQNSGEIIILVFWNPTCISDCIALKKIVGDYNQNLKKYQKDVRLIAFGGRLEDMEQIPIIFDKLKIDTSNTEIYLKSFKNQNIIRKLFTTNETFGDIVLFDNYGTICYIDTIKDFDMCNSLDILLSKKEKGDKLIPILKKDIDDVDKNYIEKKNKCFLENNSFQRKKENIFISPASAAYIIPYTEIMDNFYRNYIVHQASNLDPQIKFKIEKYIVFDDNYEVIGEDWKNVSLDYRGLKNVLDYVEYFLKGLNIELHIPSKILSIKKEEFIMLTLKRGSTCNLCKDQLSEDKTQYWCNKCDIYLCYKCGNYPNENKNIDYFIHKHALIILPKALIYETQLEERIIPKMEYDMKNLKQKANKGKDLFAACSLCGKHTNKVRYMCASCPYTFDMQEMNFTDFCQDCHSLLSEKNVKCKGLPKKTMKLLKKAENDLAHFAGEHVVIRLFDAETYEKN